MLRRKLSKSYCRDCIYKFATSFCNINTHAVHQTKIGLIDNSFNQKFRSNQLGCCHKQSERSDVDEAIPSFLALVFFLPLVGLKPHTCALKIFIQAKQTLLKLVVEYILAIADGVSLIDSPG